MVVERAKEYVTPQAHTYFRPMKFAYFGITGLKEPIFSDHQLALCDNNTLLLLRNEEVLVPMLLHRVDKEGFHVSFKVYIEPTTNKCFLCRYIKKIGITLYL